MPFFEFIFFLKLIIKFNASSNNMDNSIKKDIVMKAPAFIMKKVFQPRSWNFSGAICEESSSIPKKTKSISSQFGRKSKLAKLKI